MDNDLIANMVQPVFRSGAHRAIPCFWNGTSGTALSCGYFTTSTRFIRPAYPGGSMNNTTLKFIHCDFIESGKETILMTTNGVVA